MDISKHMNNYRLSSAPRVKDKLTYLTSPHILETLDTNLQAESQAQVETNSAERENNLNYNLILKKVKDLLNKPSNFEIYSDGKIFIKSKQKFWKGRGNVEIEVYDKEGLFLYSFENLETTANFFNVDEHIIRYRLNTGKSLILPSTPLLEEQKEVFFKRAISF